MILNHSIFVGEFAYCSVFWSPNETSVYHNEGDGHYHQWTYIISGHGVGEIWQTPTGPVLAREENKGSGQLVDLSKTKGLYHATFTKDDHLSMVMFNPVPASRQLSVEIVRGPTSRVVIADTTRITLVCITGPVTVNGQRLESLQYSKIFKGKSAELSMGENTICALVSSAE